VAVELAIAQCRLAHQTMFFQRVAKPGSNAADHQRWRAAAHRQSHSGVNRADASQRLFGAHRVETDAADLVSQPCVPNAQWDFSRIRVHSKSHVVQSQAAPLACTQRASKPVSTKLKVDATDDPLEHEADRVANEVLKLSAPTSPVLKADTGRKASAATSLWRKTTGTGSFDPTEAPAIVHRLQQDPGTPLDPVARAYFEPRFGRSFADVRVHHDSLSAAAAGVLSARAFTVGSHLAFAAGQYAPNSAAGRHLLAHELAHVAQQCFNRLPPTSDKSGDTPARTGPIANVDVRVQRAPDIKPRYEGLAGLVELTVEELDGKSRGRVLADILSTLGSPERIKRWALYLQQRRRGNDNYLYLFFSALEDHSLDAVVGYVTMLRSQGIVISRTSGSFQSLDYLDPAVEAPGGLVSSADFDRYVDDFQSVTYDLGYKPERKGWLSTALQVTYADSTKIDISIWDISDNIDSAWQNAIYESYLGPGRRAFPSRLSRKTTPRLWQEKHKALATMNSYNQDFETFTSISVAGVMSNLPIGPVEMPLGPGGRGPKTPAGVTTRPRGTRVAVPPGPQGASEPSTARPGGTAPPSAAEPTAILPNGQKLPPDNYAGGYHGTTLPPEVVMKEGLPSVGDDWRLIQHSEQSSNSAFRGVTQVPSDPVNQGGAAYWADKGGYVYQVKGVPTWNVNKALQGRVPTGGGTFRGNLMHGENEYVIPAHVPPEKITRWGVVKANPRGWLYVEWQTGKPK
jgi:hypothetical protein